MVVTLSVCDLCQREGPIRVTVVVEGSSERWDVCPTCYNKPFRKPTAADQAEAAMTMANALKEKAGHIFAEL
jgi:protein-arginine kinase activator protein McsA